MERSDDRSWQKFVAYVAIVCVLTVPFWLAGYLVEANIAPGLSVAAFAIVVPSIAAAIVVAMHGGWRAVGQLLAALWRPGRHRVLAAGLAIAVPLVAALVSWSLVAPADRVFAEPVGLLALAPVFVIAAILEEIGWSAFATETLARGRGVVVTGLVVGAVWALWHYPSLIELGRPPEWIAWWSVWTLGQRLVMVCLYVRGGSWVWAPVLYHVTSNLLWQGALDAFDPTVEALVTVMLAVIIIFAWSRPKAGKSITKPLY